MDHDPAIGETCRDGARAPAGPPNSSSPAGRRMKRPSPKRSAGLRRRSRELHLPPGGSDRPLTLRPDPVLSWSNPVMGSLRRSLRLDGGWAARGRGLDLPVLRGPPTGPTSSTRWPWQADRRREGAAVWTPSRPGVELKPIPGAPVPADSAAARLRQMRRPGAGVHQPPDQSRRRGQRDAAAGPAHLSLRGHQGRPDRRRPVRLRPGNRPRDLPADRGPTDAGWCPEWRFGATRMHGIDLRVYRHGKMVWNAPEITWERIQDRREPYTIFRFETTPRRP